MDRQPFDGTPAANRTKVYMFPAKRGWLLGGALDRRRGHGGGDDWAVLSLARASSSRRGTSCRSTPASR